MKLLKADMWSLEADLYCIPTNETLNKQGHLVMGAGVAKQAKQRYPQLPRLFGEYIVSFGHGVTILRMPDGKRLASFPTKYHWSNPSNKTLIQISLVELEDLLDFDAKDITKVILPLPGAGMGGLSFEEAVELVKHLDERYTVVYQ